MTTSGVDANDVTKGGRQYDHPESGTILSVHKHTANQGFFCPQTETREVPRKMRILKKSGKKADPMMPCATRRPGWAIRGGCLTKCIGPGSSASGHPKSAGGVVSAGQRRWMTSAKN